PSEPTSLLPSPSANTSAPSPSYAQSQSNTLHDTQASATSTTSQTKNASFHPMVTRSQLGISKPNLRYTFPVSTISPVLNTSILQMDPLADTRLDLLLMVGVDCDETFSPVVEPDTICTVLSLAASQHWLVHQLDVKNTFLHGKLSETVNMHHPPVILIHNIQIMFVFCRSLYMVLRRPLGPGFNGLLVMILDFVLLIVVVTLRSSFFSRVFLFYIMIEACSYLSGNIPWRFWSEPVTLFRSSVEAEYHDVGNVVAEIAWLRNLLRELHSPLKTTTLVYYDNINVVYLSSKPVQHQRKKHIEIDIHFVRDEVVVGHVHVLHVPSRYQFENIFTKGLLYVLFDDFCSSLSVRPYPALTARAVNWSNHLLMRRWEPLLASQVERSI
ncbi:ribonuclease H-like domain-containing protein, partial [Tanacetum coccineum]